jgi:hypothetical protein
MERGSARGRSLRIRTKLKLGVLGFGALLIGRERFARLVARALPFASTDLLPWPGPTWPSTSFPGSWEPAKQTPSAR